MNIEDKKVTLFGTWIWGLATVFLLYEFFLRTFIGSVADQIMLDFSLTVNTFAWVTSAYYFSYGIMQIPVGMLLDKFGARKILIFGTCVCAAATLLFSHAGNFFFAFLSRLMMGFGSSFGFVALLVIVSNWFPRKLNGVVNGISQFLGTLGPILAAGPMVKFLSDSNLPWQHLMDIISGIGFTLAFIMLLTMKNNNREGKGATIYLSKEKPFWYYLSTLFKNPQVWYIAFYSGIIFIPMILFGGSWGMPYLKSLKFTDAQAASAISMIWIGYAIGALLFGGASDKIERRRPILIFSAINNIILVFIIITMHGGPIYFYDVLLLLLGFGSAGQMVAFSAIVEHVDFATKATAIGINNTSITLIASIAPIITAGLIHAAHSNETQQLIPSDFFNGFIIMPILSAIAGLIAIFLIKETFCKFQKNPIFLKVDYTSESFS